MITVFLNGTRESLIDLLSEHDRIDGTQIHQQQLAVHFDNASIYHRECVLERVQACGLSSIDHSTHTELGCLKETLEGQSPVTYEEMSSGVRVLLAAISGELPDVSLNDEHLDIYCVKLIMDTKLF
jgi:hypothetical protein